MVPSGKGVSERGKREGDDKREGVTRKVGGNRNWRGEKKTPIEARRGMDEKKKREMDWWGGAKRKKKGKLQGDQKKESRYLVALREKTEVSPPFKEKVGCKDAEKEGGVACKRLG